MELLKRVKKTDLLAYFIIALGIFLRAKQYFSVLTFSWDESAVALNIINKSFANQIHPDYAEYHPPLFLWAEKIITLFLGSGELALRLLPFLSSIIALFLFYKLACKVLDEQISPVALALFALSGGLISYSSILREYSMGVMLCIAFYLILFSVFKKRNLDLKTALLIGIFGAVGNWASNALIFLLAAAGILFSIHYLIKRNYQSFFNLLIAGSFWISAEIAYYFVVLKNVPATSYLYTDLIQSHDFIHLPPSSFSDFLFYFDLAGSNLLEFQTGHLYILGALLLFVGIFALYKRSKITAGLLSLPILFAFLASALLVYPVSGRHLLFTAPAIFILIGAGIQYLLIKFERKKMVTKMILGLAILLLAVSILGYIRSQIATEEQDHLQQMMSLIASKKQTGDSIYLYNNTSAAYIYYAPKYKLSNLPYVEGTHRNLSPSSYLSNFAPLIGKKRVWLIFTHDYNWGQVDEEAFIMNYVDSIGKQIAYYSEGTSSLYLYDLSTGK